LNETQKLVQIKKDKKKMDEILKQDLTNLDSLLEKVMLQGLDYLNRIEKRKTTNNPTTIESSILNDLGLGGQETLALFNEKFEKLIVGSAGPRYWGYVTGGTTPAGIMGDWLTTIYDQNSFATKGQGDVSAIIELETINLLLDLLELPEDFLGGFVTGATMSNFTCMAVARQWFGRQIGKDFAKEGVTGKIKILSALPHSSMIKSLSMLGIGSSNFDRVKVAEGNQEAIDILDLENKIKELKGQPFILVTSAGTVNTADFDDFKTIATLKEKYNFWWHIDGAFGAFAACSPKHKHLMDGWEGADSITIDCHKWLNVPYENAVFLVKEKHKTLQVETFQNSNAPYLGNPMDNFSYLNFLPENSRRLKALPVWFSLVAYGKKGYQNIVENSIDMARLFGQFIESQKNLELLAPIRLNNVCFTLTGEENQEKVPTFLTHLNNSGKVFLTPTVYNGKKGIRASFVNWRTNELDIEIVKREILKLLN
jgi:glutamate/tyrosine decarboxylase-like PLP-dependent enzyme